MAVQSLFSLLASPRLSSPLPSPRLAPPRRHDSQRSKVGTPHPPTGICFQRLTVTRSRSAGPASHSQPEFRSQPGMRLTLEIDDDVEAELLARCRVARPSQKRMPSAAAPRSGSDSGTCGTAARRAGHESSEAQRPGGPPQGFFPVDDESKTESPKRHSEFQTQPVTAAALRL
eukprot:164615-Hanusia_phi.AAC.1